jgi:hypothetical protein
MRDRRLVAPILLHILSIAMTAERLEFTHPNVLANFAADDDPGLPSHRYVPHAIPDHGSQPRYQKRPRERWRGDPFADDVVRHSEAEQRKRRVARMLAVTAREHAPKLAAGYRDDAIAGLIEREALPAVKFIAADLLPADRARAIGRFVSILWDEIREIRIARRRRT